MIELRVIGGDHSLQAFRIEEPTVIFGRTEAADVVLDWDSMISSQHFRIDRDDEGPILVDLESSNGTLVNGRRTQRCRLNVGDRIQVGDTLIHVAASDHPPSTRGGSVRTEGSVVAGMGPRSDVVPETSQEKDTAASGELAGERELSDSDADEDVSTDQIVQVRLRITSQKEIGKVFWLSPEQSLVFGRLAQSDCCLSFDQRISGEHCRIECSPSKCCVEDLRSHGGTWLNEMRIAKAELFDGDSLRLGSTVLHVEVDTIGGRKRRDSEHIEDTGLSLAPQGLSMVAVQADLPWGAAVLVGKLTDEQSPELLLANLATISPIFLMFDFSKLPVEPPTALDLAESSPFRWLPVEAITSLPVVIEISEWHGWDQAVKAAWGNDAVIAIQSELPKPEFMAGLVELIESDHKKPGRGIMGFYWPSVFAAIFRNNTSSYAERFLQLAKLIVCENPDDTETYQVFGMPGTLEACAHIGMKIENTPVQVFE